jgi:phosphopentomutase
MTPLGKTAYYEELSMKRFFLIVLDSFGIGALPDAAAFGDEGSDTLRAVAGSPEFHAPNLTRLGLFNIEGASGGKPAAKPLAAYGRCAEKSAGKDTTVGHWEIAGLVSSKPMPTYPEGFSAALMTGLSQALGRAVICGKPYSGTAVIADYGKEHIETGALIVYTSADSVLQIAAHEDVIPLEELYTLCNRARDFMRGENGVGRVIARPFAGEYPSFVRTGGRHDFSLPPPGRTMLDALKDSGFAVIGVGKIGDIFAGRGLTETHPTTSNSDGMAKTTSIAARDWTGLCFVNLVDFDMLYGHRNDIDGYARAISEFDSWLGGFLPVLRQEDILLITADHGCDPATPSTDHSREYTPVLLYGAGVQPGLNLGTRDTMADIAATVQGYIGLPIKTEGRSFL